jgi:hypothetical protein
MKLSIRLSFSEYRAIQQFFNQKENQPTHHSGWMVALFPHFLHDGIAKILQGFHGSLRSTQEQVFRARSERHVALHGEDEYKHLSQLIAQRFLNLVVEFVRRSVSRPL